MRLWHKDLIRLLPKQQLLSQWRECCCIAKNISVNGTPNHLLVNKIMNYPMSHFYTYGMAICFEMERRGYKCNPEKFIHYFTYPHETRYVELNEVFKHWHDARYLRQCLNNLEEKAMCGGIPEKEWNRIAQKYGKSFDLIGK